MLYLIKHWYMMSFLRRNLYSTQAFGFAISSPAASCTSVTEVIDTLLKLNYLYLPSLVFPLLWLLYLGAQGVGEWRAKGFCKCGWSSQSGRGGRGEAARESELGCALMFPKEGEREGGMRWGESRDKASVRGATWDHICPPDVASTVVRHKEKKKKEIF